MDKMDKMDKMNKINTEIVVDNIVYNVMYAKFIERETYDTMRRSGLFDTINGFFAKSNFDILKNDRFIMDLCSGFLSIEQITAMLNSFYNVHENAMYDFIDCIESGLVSLSILRDTSPDKIMIICTCLMQMNGLRLFVCGYTNEQKIAIINIINKMSYEQITHVLTGNMTQNLNQILECLSLVNEYALQTLCAHIDKIMQIINTRVDNNIMFDIIDMCTGPIHSDLLMSPRTPNVAKSPM